MPTTSNYSISYPSGVTVASDIAGDIGRVATGVDALGLGSWQGTIDGATDIASGSITKDRFSTAAGELGGPWAAWDGTPFENVTSGVFSGFYLLLGKTLFLRGSFSAGTATANGRVGVTLPAGLSNTTVEQVVHATYGTTVVSASANLAIPGQILRITKNFNNWLSGSYTAGDSLVNLRINGIVNVA